MIVRNTSANALGVVVPALVAIGATPLLVHALGTALYGVLSLQLAVLVLLGVNDLGISRAIVLVSVGEGGFYSADSRAATVQAGLQLSLALALTVVIAGSSAIVLVFAFLPRQPDLLVSCLLTAVSAGLSLVTLPLRASMEVEERFVVLNAWRTVATSLLFAAPLAAALIQPTLTATAIGLLVSRIVVLLGFLKASGRLPVRELVEAFVAFAAELRRRRLTPVHRLLIRRGAWIGVGGLVSTFIGYSDRFVLGAFAAATDVGHYVIASELVTKLWLIVGALTIAVTPRLAATWESETADGFDRLFRRFAGAIAVIALASHMFLVGVGDLFLRVWLGSGYAPIIGQVLKVLSIGVSLNCVSQANATLINIGRRERSGATVQLVFLPLTIGILALGVWLAGPIGAAWALTVRLAIDAFVIRWVVHKQIGETDRHGVRSWQLLVMLLVLLAIFGMDRWLR